MPFKSFIKNTAYFLLYTYHIDYDINFDWICKKLIVHTSDFAHFEIRKTTENVIQI